MDVTVGEFYQRALDQQLTPGELPLDSDLRDIFNVSKRRTHNVRPAVGVATALSVVSTLFNLFIMRRGAMVVGEGGQPLWRDLIRIPGLIVQFLVAGPVWIFKVLSGRARSNGQRIVA